MFKVNEQSTMQVNWSNVKSDKFLVSMGANQGSVNLLIYFVSIEIDYSKD